MKRGAFVKLANQYQSDPLMSQKLMRGVTEAATGERVKDYLRENQALLWTGRLGRGYLCGMILVFTLARARAGESPASLNNTFNTFAGLLQPKVKRGAGLTEISGSWKRFRTVAHFWAMLNSCRLSEEIGASPDLLNDWLAKAENLRRQGEEYRLPKSNSALLNANQVWHMHEDMRLPPAQFPIPTPESIETVLRDLKIEA